ncbi:energy-coupling factor ABC transporter ATP-binding protein [Nocardioides marmoribigeumensis]|uniref:Biotin transport system ATP-binding protein n=1 Tax=Nocardioides marmoribigeumensis TaxID=433649 RepID=A0ABU2BYR2_9ACTN|nr:ABC transporter ATP-binding protein [Nocardioides marmoribigeumensis]MDR7363527.1 biotin transport system ATP-binding protein [Nocardioides marmoribigeumensis]
MSRLELTGVTHAYGVGSARREVLTDLSVTLTEPRIGVVGANGSGKSTFARLLNGLVVPTRGTVSVDGLDTRTHAKDVRRRVGFCFTDPDAQIVMPTVQEDVGFGLRRRMSKSQVAERVAAVLETYGLAGHADHPTHLLSGGQKQLLALVSVLVTEPSVLVLDEPTTLLDLRNTRRVAETVAGLPQQVVMVTHDLDLLDDFDRVLVFDRARLVLDGSPSEALAHYRALMGA